MNIDDKNQGKENEIANVSTEAIVNAKQ